MDFETIWRNILYHEGEIFKTIRSKEYRYTVYPDHLLINDDKRRRITKAMLRSAILISNPTPSKIQQEGIWGPSYVYGIITDPRII